ncbi:hypothetical protein FQR65_LT14555 [Abscondita terminalis]|nr:hypothetical protein FQR65_LT14555 [Abscondita terminalis]
MSRVPRTTKAQKDVILIHLESNRILLGGKLHPFDVVKLKKAWEAFAADVNAVGPPKTVKQWKESVSEIKTNVRRRAREVQFGYKGTGDGSSPKPLNDFEERLLALISKLNIIGTNLSEPGTEDIIQHVEISDVETQSVEIADIEIPQVQLCEAEVLQTPQIVITIPTSTKENVRLIEPRWKHP